jgi:hypothetical protein
MDLVSGDANVEEKWMLNERANTDDLQSGVLVFLRFRIGR